MKIYSKNNNPDGASFIIAHNAERATTFFTRLRGLMFRKTFGDADALYLSPCTSIHTYFMKFPIDILCLDDGGVVVDMVAAMPPSRILIPSKKTQAVLELPQGAIARTGVRVSSRIVFV